MDSPFFEFEVTELFDHHDYQAYLEEQGLLILHYIGFRKLYFLLPEPARNLAFECCERTHAALGVLHQDESTESIVYTFQVIVDQLNAKRQALRHAIFDTPVTPHVEPANSN